MTAQRLGLGLAGLGRPAYITGGRSHDLGDDRSVAALRARTHEVLDHAVARGVRYLDAARSYGLAEQFLAQWLDARPPLAGVTVASKWGYTYVGGWRTDADVHEVKDHSRAAFERQRAETSDLLGGSLSLYSIHSVTPDSPALGDTELLGSLTDWSTASGVRIGLTTSGPQQAEVVRRALRTTVGGAPVFSAVQATWNPLEPSAGPALQEAHDAGWLVVVKEAVANGRLTGDGAPPPLLSAARGAGLTPDALALAVALAQPWAPTVLSGAVTTDQLDSNLASTQADPAEALAAADELSRLVEEPEAYWAGRSGRAWA